jgi:hypothetical protein
MALMFVYGGHNSLTVLQTQISHCIESEIIRRDLRKDAISGGHDCPSFCDIIRKWTVGKMFRYGWFFPKVGRKFRFSAILVHHKMCFAWGCKLTFSYIYITDIYSDFINGLHIRLVCWNERNWELSLKINTLVAFLWCEVLEPSYNIYIYPVGFEVFTAVTMKNAAFRDVVPCEFIIIRRFGGTCRLHIYGRRNNASEDNGGDTFLRNIGLK